MKSFHIVLEADLLDDTHPNYKIEEVEKEITRMITRELMLKPQNFRLKVSENQ